jgi:pimeloyl-ACP methyl ester carboxylesterase
MAGERSRSGVRLLLSHVSARLSCNRRSGNPVLRQPFGPNDLSARQQGDVAGNPREDIRTGQCAWISGRVGGASFSDTRRRGGVGAFGSQRRGSPGTLWKLEMPVTIIAGEQDRLIDPTLQSERLHGEIGQSQYILISGHGHMVHQTATRVVADAIKSIDPR